jgi:RNA polymerase sigma-70 factor, ECF subfamily
MINLERANAKEDHLKALLLCGLSGDESAYRVFLQELSIHLRAFLRRRLARIPDEVEDLVQEALLAIHNQRHTYDAGQPVTAWIHAIAKYKLIDLLRRRALREDFHEPLDEASELVAGEDNQAADARRDLATLLEQLPDKQRLPIVYMKIEGLSAARTGQLVGMSESAVKVAVHRGLKVLATLVRGKL